MQVLHPCLASCAASDLALTAKGFYALNLYFAELVPLELELFDDRGLYAIGSAWPYGRRGEVRLASATVTGYSLTMRARASWLVVVAAAVRRLVTRSGALVPEQS